MMQLFFLTSMLTFSCLIKIVGFERQENQTDPQEFYIQFPEYHTHSNSPEPQSDFPSIPEPKLPSEPFKTFWDWKNACIDALKKGKSPITKEQFIQEMKNFCSDFKNEKSRIVQPKNWVKPSHSETAMPSMHFLLGSALEPYVIKLEVDSNEKTVFIGDIHGDIQSFNEFLESLIAHNITDPHDPFKVNPKSYIIFLGDYVDRGESGIEVLYALSRFIRVNMKDQLPKVFGLRGNHEDTILNRHTPGNNLNKEIITKFGDSNLWDTIESFYNCLPFALFLKTKANALLACHGGIEPGFSDAQTLLNAPGKLRYLLIDQLYRKEMFEKFSSEFFPAFIQLIKYNQYKNFDPCADDFPLKDYGFLWTDYYFNPNESKQALITFNPNRGMKFPKQATKEWFRINSSPSCQLIGNIRAHQHGPETMPRLLNHDNKSDPEEVGLAKIWVPIDQKQPTEKIWPGMVCTLCACPNTGYGSHYEYSFGTYTVLTTGDQLDDWKLKVYRFIQNIP